MSDNGTEDFDDDLDFDTLDDDDLSSGEWDDVPEGDDLDDLEELGDLDLDDESAAPPPKQKTFLQKNFNAIVISAAVVIGGLMIAPMILSGGQPAAPNAEQAAPEQPMAESQMDSPVGEIAELQDDVPPQPAPINAMPEEAAQDGVLTPMPELGNDQSMELAELELPSEDQPAQMLEETPALEPVSEPMAEPAAEPISDIAELPAELTETQPLEETSPALELSPEPEIAEAPEAAIELPVETPLEETAPAPTLEESAPAPELAASIEEAAPAQPAEDVSELNSTIDDLKQQLEELKAAKAQSDEQAAKAQAEAEAAQKDAQKAADAAKQAAEAAKAAEAKAAAAPVAVAAAPAPEAKPQKSTAENLVPPTKPAPILTPSSTETAKAPTTSTANVKWTLRSARPGRATISKEGSNDTLVVEVGETIKGLGKVHSIAQENGKWVVRASQGVVSQP